jgi:diguanylate cyclase
MAADRYTQRERHIAAMAAAFATAVAIAAIILRHRLRVDHAVVAIITAIVELAIVVPTTLLIVERRGRRSSIAHHPTAQPTTASARPLQPLMDALARALVDAETAAVVLVDLDGFKLINEAFGHDVGDHVIATVEARLRSATGPGTALCHIGGDEFGLVLTGPINLAAAKEQATFLADVVAAPLTIVGIELANTASLGVALAHRANVAAEAIDHAATAVHRAKRLGGRQVVLYDETLRAEARDRLALSAALRHAADRDELLVEFQTINNLVDGVPFAIEALVRWNHPTLGLLGPDRFVPLAEDIGAIKLIGRWVVDAACRQLRGIDSACDSSKTSQRLGLWINVSPKQLDSLEFASDIQRTVSSYGIDPTRVTLEITENALIDDIDGVTAVLHALRAFGVRIAIDDFGTGFSALAYLNELPVDVLKIDRRFVSGLVGGSDRAILSSVIQLGFDKGLMVVAEGVESVGQRDLLQQLGCASAQGWYFGRATSSAEIVRVMRHPTPQQRPNLGSATELSSSGNA